MQGAVESGILSSRRGNSNIELTEMSSHCAVAPVCTWCVKRSAFDPSLHTDGSGMSLQSWTSERRIKGLQAQDHIRLIVIRDQSGLNETLHGNSNDKNYKLI